MPTKDNSPTIADLMRSLFPNGTNLPLSGSLRRRSTASGRRSILKVPQWPPDLFAGMAILLARSGAYAHPAFFHRSASFLSSKSSANWNRLGNAIRDGHIISVLKELEHRWSIITRNGNAVFVSDDTTRNRDPPDWAIAAFELLQIADIACAEIGFEFAPRQNSKQTPSATIYSSQQEAYLVEHRRREFRVPELKNMELDYEKVRALLESTGLPHKKWALG